jgi:hydroxypyruvate isomerase
MIRGFSANLGFLWPGLTLPDQMRAAARAGFEAIELHWPYATPPRQLRDLCGELGLALLGINTVRGDVARGDNGLAALPGRRDEFRAAMAQSIDYCRLSGATAIHCMAGRVAAPDRPAARDTLVENLKHAGELATTAGVTLLVEPLNPGDAPDYLYSTNAEAAEIIARVGSPNLRLMFDAYHVGRVGADIDREIETYMPLVGHIQIASIPARREPSLANGGHFPGFVRTLERLGYAGWIGAEYRPEAATDAGLGWRDELPLAR